MALFAQPATYTVGLLSDHTIGALIVGNHIDVNFKVAGGGNAELVAADGYTGYSYAGWSQAIPNSKRFSTTTGRG